MCFLQLLRLLLPALVIDIASSSVLRLVGVQQVIPFSNMESVRIQTWLVSGYLGCFRDDSKKRDLPIDRGSDKAMTPSLCNKKCTDHKYFGIQSGNHCWCGDSFGKYGSLPFEECSSLCEGDWHARCGGRNANVVFSVTTIATPKISGSLSTRNTSYVIHCIVCDWPNCGTVLFNATLGSVLVQVLDTFPLILFEKVLGPANFSTSLNTWSLTRPSLYRLNITVMTTNQQPISKFGVRFGFRSFTRTAKGQISFNNKPLFLRGVAINPPGRGTVSNTNSSFAHEYLSNLKIRGVNIVRTDGVVWWNAADELGMLVFMGRYGAPHCGNVSTCLKDFNKSMEIYLSEYFERYITHPSLVINILSNEQSSNWDSFFNQTCEFLKSWNGGSRLCLSNAGFGGGRTGDFEDSHPYGGWYGGNYFGVAFKHMKPSGLNLPVTFSECIGTYTGPNGTLNVDGKQLAAALMWSGHSDVDTLRTRGLTYQAFEVKMVSEPMRWLRSLNPSLAGVMLFTQIWFNWNGVSSFDAMVAKPAADQLRVSYSPLLISLEMWTPHLYAGHILNFTVHVVNDYDNYKTLADVDIYYELQQDGKTILHGKSYLKQLEYYETASFPLQMKLPIDLPTDDYLIVSSVISLTNIVLAKNTADIFIAQKEDWIPDIKSSPISLYDPIGHTADALHNLGFNFSSINRIEDAKIGNPLIIGENVWSKDLDSSTNQAALKKLFSAGRLVILQQVSSLSKTSFSWLPVGFTFKAGDGAHVNAERPKHPIFSNSLSHRLKFWSDHTGWTSHAADSQFQMYSQRTSSKQIVGNNDDDSNSNYVVWKNSTTSQPEIVPVAARLRFTGTFLDRTAVLANFQRGLDDIVLAEIFASVSAKQQKGNSGSAVLSGFDLISKRGLDPVADRLLFNIVQYVATIQKHSIYPTFTEHSIIKWGDYVSEKGLIVGPVSGLLVNVESVSVDHPGAKEKQSVPRGRRAFGPFGYSATCHIEDLNPSSMLGTGTFFIELTKPVANVTTKVHNPTKSSTTFTQQINTKNTTISISAGKQADCTSTLSQDTYLSFTFFASKGLVIDSTTFN